MDDEQNHDVGRFRLAVRKYKRVSSAVRKFARISSKEKAAHGPHRRPSQTIHIGTARPADSSSGGANPTSVSVPAGTTATATIDPNAVTTAHSFAIGLAAALRHSWPPYYTEHSFDNAGIRTGVVKGYRGWYVDDCKLAISPALERGFYIDPFKESQHKLRLLSIVWYNEWEAGQPLSGDPSSREAGVYSFKTYDRAYDYTCDLFMHGVNLDSKFAGFMIGEVESWGEIYEHDLGYRAQFCLPTKFVFYWPLHNSNTKDVIQRLSDKYQIPYEKAHFNHEREFPIYPF